MNSFEDIINRDDKIHETQIFGRSISGFIKARVNMTGIAAATMIGRTDERGPKDKPAVLLFRMIEQVGEKTCFLTMAVS